MGTDHIAELERKIAEAHVPKGWSIDSWIGRLEQLADRCRTDHPDQADRLMRWATAVRSRQTRTSSSPSKSQKPLQSFPY